MARKKHRRSSSTALAPRGRARGIAKHVGSAGRSGLGMLAGSQRTSAGAMALLLGVAKARGWEIPYIETLGEAGSIAAGGWAAEHFLGLKHPLVKGLTTAGLVLFLFELGQEKGGEGALKLHKKVTGDEEHVAIPMR